MPYSSRVQDALDDIVTELGTISTANGYYTDPTIVRAIRPADAVVEPPEIGVQFVEESISAMDMTADAFQSRVTVYIVGTASANSPVDADSSELVEETEKLRHDIKRCIAKMFYKYLPNSGVTEWGVERTGVMVIPAMGLGKNRNKAQVLARLRIRVWAMDTTLAS